MNACPKPERPERNTAACREYMALVRQLPCICCAAPCEHLHHPIHGRHAQRKSSDMDVLPMCEPHHRALHDHPAAWRAIFGMDAEYVEPTRAAVEALKARHV